MIARTMGILARVSLRRLLEGVGHRIRELREAKKLTQAEFAELIDSQVKNFQKIEHGERNVTMKTLVKIASALDVTVAEFFVPPTTVRPGRGRPRRRG